MLGGGTFTAQNKVLPGAYMNFVSAGNPAAVLSKRGTAAMPFVMDWGQEDAVITVTAEEFETNSLKLFGYESSHKQMQAFREIFCNAAVLLCYRLNKGTQKAENELAKAVYGGSRGNALNTVVRRNVDDDTKFDVETWLDQQIVDVQTVGSTAELQSNYFIEFKKEAILKESAGLPLTAGSDGTGRTGEAYQRFLDKIEPFSFHALGCNTDEAAVSKLFAAFTKRLREEQGVKFQTVVYRASDVDYEGVISVENKLLHVDQQVFGAFSLVYWVTGAAAGCEVQKSNTNRRYNGEYEIDTDYTQAQLSEGIKAGKFLFHKVGNDVRVLTDINTLTTETQEKGADFKNNQTIRVLDQIGNDIASIFNKKYLGIMPNDASGRVSLWDSIVSYYKELADIRAIEAVSPESVIVEAGKTKRSVTVSGPVTPINCMEQLYMTVVVQ